MRWPGVGPAARTALPALTRLARGVPRRRTGASLDGHLLTDLSHELRTPLASILGYAELLTDGDDVDPDTRRMLHAIRRNASRQAQVLENLATLADIRRGDLTRTADPVDLAGLLADLPGRLSDSLAHRQVELELRHPPQLPAVAGDSRRLRQAVVELTLGVVDRCGPGGTVSVAASTRPGRILLTISSTVADTVSAGLHGVGLAMAQAVLREHGGGVRLVSAGGGTTTLVHLPCRPDAAPAA